MIKVFLSHSSKQKDFVDTVARKLGRANIVYDELTFESGGKTLDEIFQGIESSGVFVFFISNDSLDSKWVQQEIVIAEQYLKDGKLKRFLPILISQEVKYDDERIPEWMQNEYNIKFISSSGKCVSMIQQAIQLANWELNPKRSDLDQLFIGRQEQSQAFEERFAESPIPTAVFVCGLPSIGRRKFLSRMLTDLSLCRRGFIPRTIVLDQRSSIEDFIVQLFGLGYIACPNLDGQCRQHHTESRRRHCHAGKFEVEKALSTGVS